MDTPLFLASRRTGDGDCGFCRLGTGLKSTVAGPGAGCGPPDASYRRGFGSSRVVTVRASHVNSAGSIDSPFMQSMADQIKEHLNAEFVDVKDAYGDGRHVSNPITAAGIESDYVINSIDVVASSFEGQSAVTRQRMVYKAIWEELQSTMHAVDQMITRTLAKHGQRRTKELLIQINFNDGGCTMLK